MIDSLLQSMQRLIVANRLQIMQTYPNDILIHDRRYLDHHAVPGATIAWVVGDLHSHMTFLGVHPEENQRVTWLSRLSAGDKFFRIDVTWGGSFHIVEMNREKFEALALTKVRYAANGPTDSFALMRDTQKIGAVSLSSHGAWESRAWKVGITQATTSRMDRIALQMWADYAVNKAAQSLFAKREFIWSNVSALKVVA